MLHFSLACYRILMDEFSEAKDHLSESIKLDETRKRRQRTTLISLGAASAVSLACANCVTASPIPQTTTTPPRRTALIRDPVEPELLIILFLSVS